MHFYHNLQGPRMLKATISLSQIDYFSNRLSVFATQRNFRGVFLKLAKVYGSYVENFSYNQRNRKKISLMELISLWQIWHDTPDGTNIFMSNLAPYARWY